MSDDATIRFVPKRERATEACQHVMKSMLEFVKDEHLTALAFACVTSDGLSVYATIARDGNLATLLGAVVMMQHELANEAADTEQ